MHGGTHWVLEVAFLLAAGLVSGFASGLFGIGGGIVRVPIFLYVFPALGASPAVAMHLAVGTSLALAIPSTLAATWRQYQSGTLDTAMLRTWVPALVGGVLLGLYLAYRLPGQILQGVFGVVMLLLSGKMLLCGEASLTSALPHASVRMAIAFVIGTVSTMAGISGGPIVTPILTLLSVPIHRAIAVSAAGSAPIATIGAAGMAIAGWHEPALPPYALGYVDLPALLLVLPIVTISAPLGVRAANRLSGGALRTALGAVLLAAGAYMTARLWLD